MSRNNVEKYFRRDNSFSFASSRLRQLEEKALEQKKKGNVEWNKSVYINEGRQLCWDYAVKKDVGVCQFEADRWINELLGK